MSSRSSTGPSGIGCRSTFGAGEGAVGDWHATTTATISHTARTRHGEPACVPDRGRFLRMRSPSKVIDWIETYDGSARLDDWPPAPEPDRIEIALPSRGPVPGVPAPSYSGSECGCAGSGLRQTPERWGGIRR